MRKYDDMPPGMPFDDVDPEDVRRVRSLSGEERRAEILKMERHIDEHYSGIDAWDMYFALMHEAHMADLPEDFDRLRSKIDRTQYNPFHSTNAGIVFLARWRLNAALEAKEE